MVEIDLPNGWKPRPYQKKLWKYLANGGRYAYQIAHRRWGKDEIALHNTACAAFERVGTYWHLLPEAAHARKAIWTAINPHTGKRRIDEAFPVELRKTTREQEMFIEFVNGSTWQVGGSDRYNTLVGSSPAGVVFSEWALGNPAAWAYVRPILLENGGWVMFITTPRGHNHAERMLRAAQKMPGAYADVSDVSKTGVFQAEALEQERLNLIGEYGEDFGQATFDQEYNCSFDAAIMGSYYSAWIAKAKAEGRVRKVALDPNLPVHMAWDIGHTDDTAIWFFQVPFREIHVLDCHSSSGQGVTHYIELVQTWMREHGAKLGNLYLPHDAKHKTFAADGKTTEEQFAKVFGWDKTHIVPQIGIQQGIDAARTFALPRAYFDEQNCADGLDALGQYRREWDEVKRAFGVNPVHDWTSHIADAFRMLAVAVREEKGTQPPPPPPKFPLDLSIDALIARQRAKRLAEE